MAGNQNPKGVWDAIEQWWNSEPTPPPPPRNLPRVDPRTGNRTQPAPPTTWAQGLANLGNAAIHSQDVLRDTTKGVYRAVTHPLDTVNSLVNAGHRNQMVSDAQFFEQNGYWPKSGQDILFGFGRTGKDLYDYRQQAMRMYKQDVAPYTYVDPQTGKRKLDQSAMFDTVTKNPQAFVTPVLTEGASMFGSAAEAAAAANMARTAAALKAAQRVAKVGAVATNPAGAAAGAVAGRVAAPVISRLKWRSAMGADGGLSAEVQQAMRDAGYNPDNYRDPEIAQKLAESLNKNRSLGAPAIKQAIADSMGVPVTRSMAAGQAPHPSVVPAVEGVRTQANDVIAQRAKESAPPTVMGPDGKPYHFDANAVDPRSGTAGMWVGPNGDYVPNTSGNHQVLNASKMIDGTPVGAEAARLRDVGDIVNGDVTPYPEPSLIQKGANLAASGILPAKLSTIGATVGTPLGVPYLGGRAGWALGQRANGLVGGVADSIRETRELAGPAIAPEYPDIFTPITRAEALNSALNAPTPPSTPTPAPETQSSSSAGTPTQAPAQSRNRDKFGLPWDQTAAPGSAPEQAPDRSPPKDKFGLPWDPPEAPAPQPENQGGRVAYKKGGKVSPHIEPLVQDLMSRYKHAKKAETATTKPLLQHHDKAIVRALNIAKKAI